MRDYSTLTDAEINAKLAEKMGDPHLLHCETAFGGGPWNPCDCRDDLAVVVGALNTRAEMSMRNLLEEAWGADESAAQTFHGFLLTCPPRIIAEACLEVLEG